MTSTPAMLLDPARRLVAILTNPLAGKRPSGKLVEELARELTARQFETCLCYRREDLTSLATERALELRCIVAAGGDGTVAEAINRAPNAPLAMLPLGNENLVARHFAIKRSVEQAAAIVESGHCRQLDLARAGDRVFSLMASAGFDAEVVRLVHHRRVSHINRFTYAAAISRALARYPFSPIDVELPDTGERLTGAMVLAFNLPEYAFRLAIAPQARADDGQLDLLVFTRQGVWNLARHLAAVVRSRQHALPDFEHRLVQRLRITAPPDVPLQIDGDPAGPLPLDVEVLPGALCLLVPPGSVKPP